MTASRPETNWGRWGDEDERGTLNLLTPDYLRGVLSGPFQGRVDHLGIDVGGATPALGRRPPLHLMSVDGGDFAALDRLDGFAFADDYLITPCHASTHVDALAHVLSGGAMYNGNSWRQVRSTGAKRCAIDGVGAIVARCHLLDVAKHRGVPQLDPGDEISAEELEAVRVKEGFEINPGDAVLVRTGFISTLLAHPRRVGAEPGLAVDCAEWIADNDVSVVGADNSAVEHQDEQQFGAPLHERVVAGLGCYLIELLDLERVASAGVHGGLLVVAPLKITGGVGSPVNPILIS